MLLPTIRNAAENIVCIRVGPLLPETCSIDGEVIADLLLEVQRSIKAVAIEIDTVCAELKPEIAEVSIAVDVVLCAPALPR